MNNDDNATERLTPYPNFRWLVTELQRTARSSNNETPEASQKDGKRIALLDDLIRQLDIVIYCQICVLYYCDCSVWRLLLRCLAQFALSNPRAIFLFAFPIHRGYLTSAFLINLLCAVAHLLIGPAQGDELSRGYVHGSLLIDFVGEPAPTPRWKTITIDICIFALQLLLLSAVMTKRDLELSSKNLLPAQIAESIVPDRALQDIDAEERGVRTDQAASDDAEMHPPPEAPDTMAPTGHVFDEFYAGQVNILVFNPKLTVLRAWKRYEITRYLRMPP